MFDDISTLSDGNCEDISDDYITVYRETPDGGSVTLTNGATNYENCAGDIVFDVMHTTTAPHLSYWYIITNDNNEILGYLNSADGNTLDLSVAPPGECRIWGWNYKGEPNPVMGEDIYTLADGDCEDISNDYITVTRIDCDNSYVLVGIEEVSLEENIIHSGGVGVTDSNGEAEIDENTMITAFATFLRADDIEIKDGSVVNNYKEEPATPNLPVFIV